MAQTERLAQLRQNLIEYFSDEELRTLCFDLGVDYDNLPGRAKADKARELLSDLDHRGRIPDLIKLCSTQRPNVAWQEILTAIQAEPPFKGLQYFDEADADLFFGRELLTARLVGRLRQGRFLAVVGASGGGKSSVVRAGLVPALKRGEPFTDGILLPEGSRGWQYHVITPGAHPLKELAASLTPPTESVEYTDKLMTALRNTAHSLDLEVSRLLKRTGGSRLLLLVDQFEELFTACKDEVERKAFVDNLLHAIAPETQGAILVVIALRADFYAHCAQYANLRQVLAQHQEFIGPMRVNDELRCAIEKPAKRNGWEFETGLVDLLLRDVGDEPGALPLLSHALLETWRRRHGRTLTFEGYYESGGVRGAIAKTADTIFSQLTPEQQTIARNIFLRLTELGEGTQDMGRRVALTEFVPRSEDRSAVEAMLKTLADARLVTTSEETVEVAHEALIREWPRLRQWLDEDRDGLRIHRQLTHNAQEWLRLNRDDGTLYRGARLAQAREWAYEHTHELNTLEQEFLQAAIASAEMARRRLEALVEIARALTSTLDLTEVLDLLLARLVDVVPFDSGLVMLLHGYDMEIVAARGFPAQAQPPQTRISLLGEDNEIFRQIYLSQKPLPIPDVSQWPDFQHVQGLPRACSWLGIPLARFDVVIGMLSLTRETPHPFSDEEVTLATAFAGQAAIALENARLYDGVTRAYDQLEKLDRTKSDFIGIASHELRTPLTTLRGYSQILANDSAIKSNPFHVELVTGIQSGAMRLQEIVESMLDMAKIDSRALQLDPKPLSLPVLLQAVCNTFDEALVERHLTLRLEDMSYLPALEADREALRKVFYHLIGNAIKYTPDGGTITISGQALPDQRDLAEGGIEIVVSDTGIGIDPRFHSMIFEKFYQTGQIALHSTGKTKFKGSGPGLGLAIVQGIVQAHGGRVWVASPGYDEQSCPGSQFHVVLPLRQNKPAS